MGMHIAGDTDMPLKSMDHRVLSEHVLPCSGDLDHAETSTSNNIYLCHRKFSQTVTEELWVLTFYHTYTCKKSLLAKEKLSYLSILANTIYQLICYFYAFL